MEDPGGLVAERRVLAPDTAQSWALELGPSAGCNSRPAGWESPALLGITLALVSFGLITVYSASMARAQALGLADYHFVMRQGVGVVVGLGLLLVASRLDYRRLKPLAWPALLVTMGLLLILVVPWTHGIAPVLNGARRWLFLGPFALQPSELCKLVVVVWTAALAVKKQEFLPSLSRGLLPFLVIWGILNLLIFFQPDLSAALLVLLLGLLVVFAAGARIGHFLLLTAVGIPLLWGQVDAVGYRLRRIVAFLDPAHDVAGLSYQINQSLIAVGSGGLLGKGLGRSEQKFGFLPEAHNDFIFAMIGEEWGFVGLVVVVLVFAAVGVIGFRIARMAADLFGFLLAVGLTSLIVVQALLHMAVTTALVPTTGVTLPFISYGRSSMVVCLVAVGLLVSIVRVADRRDDPAQRGAS